MIAVIDIDGVLADATHRQHLVESRPKDWDGFFAAVGGDAPIAEGIDLARTLAEEHEVVLLSGRPERTRPETESWLLRCEVPFSRLVLRPDHDRRAAADFKAEAIRSIGTPAEVEIVVDDDRSVAERLESQGYRTHVFG